MVKFTHDPPKEIVVHQILKTSLESFTNKYCIPNAYPSVWVDGILFQKFTVPPNDTVIEDILNGKIHWNVLEFVKVPKYVDLLSRTDGNFKTPIIDMGYYPLYQEFVKWLKKQKIWEDEN